MPDNPYDHPITDTKTLRDNAARWEDLVKKFDEEYKVNLWQFEKFDDYVAFQKAHPQLNLPHLLPDQWLSDSDILYRSRYPRGRIDEWEEEKRQQQLALLEKQQRTPRNAFNQATYRAD